MIREPDTILPSVRSLLEPRALAEEITRVYAIDQPVECVLERSLTNDVYRLRTASEHLGDYTSKSASVTPSPP